MLMNMMGGLEGLPSLLIYKYKCISANYHKTLPGQCEVRHAHRTPSDIKHCGKRTEPDRTSAVYRRIIRVITGIDHIIQASVANIYSCVL